MADTSLRGNFAPATPTPVEWLAAFEAAGGWYIVGDGGKITLGWVLEDDGNAVEAKRLWDLATGTPELRADLRMFLINRGPYHGRH